MWNVEYALDKTGALHVHQFKWKYSTLGIGFERHHKQKLNAIADFMINWASASNEWLIHATLVCIFSFLFFVLLFLQAKRKNTNSKGKTKQGHIYSSRDKHQKNEFTHTLYLCWACIGKTADVHFFVRPVFVKMYVKDT